jgi:hypothetical protein
LQRTAAIVTSKALKGTANNRSLIGRTFKLPITIHIIGNASIQRIKTDSINRIFLVRKSVTPARRKLQIPHKALLIGAEGNCRPRLTYFCSQNDLNKSSFLMNSDKLIQMPDARKARRFLFMPDFLSLYTPLYDL